MHIIFYSIQSARSYQVFPSLLRCLSVRVVPYHQALQENQGPPFDLREMNEFEKRISIHLFYFLPSLQVTEQVERIYLQEIRP